MRVEKKLLTILFILVCGVYWCVSDMSNLKAKTGEEEIIVAVLDTGYTGENARVIAGADVISKKEEIDDGNGHGTNVADIILNQTPDQVKVLAIKAADYTGCSTEEAAYQAVKYAMKNGADIIHISMNMSNLEKESSLVKIVNKAIESGIDVVVSAGNHAKETANVFPANIEQAIVVSAVDEEDTFCSYSNYGETIDFSAYGRYKGDEGTSYAAARVTARLAEEYINGGSIETLRGKAIDAGAKGRDQYYGYGILITNEKYEESWEIPYSGKSANDIGYHILDINWRNTDAEMLDAYFTETDKAYVGMYLSGLCKEELEELKQKSEVLRTNVLVQEFELSGWTSESREVANYEENFIENAIKECQSYEKKLAISAAYLILLDDAYFAVSSENRNDVYYFQLSGFHYTVDIPNSPWFNMFNPSRIRATRTTVKRSTDFGAVYVTGFSSYLRDAGGFATRYIDPYTGQEITTDYFYAIDSGSNISLSYGLVISVGGYSNYREGYHTEEQDIIQMPYNYTHIYPEYTYTEYRKPLQYLFSYYNPSTNDTEYSVTPQRVKAHASNFKKLITVNQTIWHDGVYKNGYDYRNVDESLSLSEKLGKYLADWDYTVVPNVNIYSNETSLTSTGFSINANLMESLGIQWNNGETSTVAVRNDIPEYNFPLVINTYAIRYNGNGATGGTMPDTAMTYNTAKNLNANQYNRTGYVFKGWSTTAGGTVAYTDKQLVNNLTLSHNVVVDLYAVWEPITYTVRFHGNGSQKGTMSDLLMPYDVEKSLTRNKFGKTGYTFRGWNTKVDGSGVSYADGANVRNLTRTAGAVIDLYAQWTANKYTINFYSNGGIGSMGSISAVYDVPVQLRKNTFFRNNAYGPSVFLGWNTDADILHALYADEETLINLTDVSGGVVNLYAIWDDCPWIVAEDLYYTLEDAQSGRITYEELMRHATAEDREAGGAVLPGINEEKGTSFAIIDYMETDFTQFRHEGSVTETYQVIDSIGNKYQKMITVYIVDSNPVYEQPVGTTRFISAKYYNESYENGGLEDNSIWKTNPDYIQVIQDSFENSKNNAPIMRFCFTYEEILQMKKFVWENGTGNMKNKDVLQRFYDEFMMPNITK